MKKAILFCLSLMFTQMTFATALHSYLVTWDPHSVSSRDDFYKHLPEQATSMLELWKADAIENIYLDPKQKDIKGEDIPMVMFVVKADNEESAHQLLADMPYVRHKVISYNIEPIGNFWLGKYDPALFNNKSNKEPDMENPDKVVLINPFEVPKGEEQAAIKHWEKARDFLKSQPGYISTQLHRSIQPNARFHMINVAEWESEEAFKLAIKNMNKEVEPAKIQGLRFYPALYEAIKN